MQLNSQHNYIHIFSVSVKVALLQEKKKKSSQAVTLMFKMNNDREI